MPGDTSSVSPGPSSRLVAGLRSPAPRQEDVPPFLHHSPFTACGAQVTRTAFIGTDHFGLALLLEGQTILMV